MARTTIGIIWLEVSCRGMMSTGGLGGMIAPSPVRARSVNHGAQVKLWHRGWSYELISFRIIYITQLASPMRGTLRLTCSISPSRY